MKPTKEQTEKINRLLNLSESQVKACLKALSEDATARDINTACHLAFLNGIK